MAGKYYWLKLKRDFFKRHDIQIIEAMPNGKDYILFYLKLLCESVDHEGNLRFSDEIPYNEEMLATITHTNIDVVRSATKIFTGLNMMEVMDDGTFYMSEVDKMLGSETEWAKKKRDYRERQKLLESGQCPPIEDNVLPLSDKSKSKRKSKSKNINKSRYGEFQNVLLTEEEYEKLKVKFPDYKERIESLSEYMRSKGKTYKDHYATILSWARKEERENKDKPKPVEPKKYKVFEKEDYEKEDFVPDQMPEELRNKIGGLFNAD